MKQHLLALLFLLLCAGKAFSQNQVQGTVVDERGEALPGVSIMEKNTKNGVSTSADGKFTLTVQPNAVLVATYIGYVAQEIPVHNRSTIKIGLKPDGKMLDEVVLIGYQSLRKSQLTGAVSNLQSKDLNLTNPTVGQALVGKIAGVQVSQVSGAPYESTKIRVRGVGSINASSSPLYVIDGYPAGNDVYINPNDIQSIDILKDAASAAIYGSRASGGVILITTKRGREGKSTVEFDIQSGIQQLEKKVDLLNSTQFVDLLIEARNTAYKNYVLAKGIAWDNSMYSDENAVRVKRVGNAGSVSIPTEYYDFTNQKMIAPTVNTDWQDELYKTSAFQRYTLSFSGGTAKARYFVSGAYQNQPGILPTTGQERMNLIANIDANMSERLKVGVNVSLTDNDNKETREGRFHQGPILGALIYMPIFKPYNEDGTVRKFEASSLSPSFAYQTLENPIALLSETKVRRKGLRSRYNANATYSILPELNFNANVGMLTYSEKYDFYQPTSLSSGTNAPYSDQAKAAAFATSQNLQQKDMLGEFTMNYIKQFDKHNLNVLAGYTVQNTTNDTTSVTANGFINDAIPNITGKGADPTNFSLNNGTGKDVNRLLSYLARVNYNYNDRYYIAASFRRDGSSRFGPLNRWGNFPSVALAWNLSNEPFYNNLLGERSALKLRASWGLSGNYNIGNYNYERVVSSPAAVVFGTNTVASSIWPQGMRDPELGWESTSQYNVGLDAELLKGRLSVITNLYLSHSYNLLFNQPVSAIGGSSSILTNLKDSKVENKGFDVQLDGRVINKRDFTMNASANLSLNRNKVLDLGGASTIMSSGAERSYITHVTMTGQPVGMFYGFQVGGIVRESDMVNGVAKQARSASSTTPLAPGDLWFVDVNGDGIVNDLDKAPIASPYPDFIYGFSLSAAYKGFDFSTSWNGSQGNSVLDGQDYYLFNMEASGNQYAKVDKRYRNEQAPGNVEAYRASRGSTQSNSTRLSSFYIQDGSYLRITNITLGYTMKNLPLMQRMKVEGLRIYAGIDNAYTFTNYLGYNPEVDYNNGANLTPGVDYGKYPLVRSYNFGVKLTL